ncbi:Y-family DNA polymerase [Halopseudomonas sabulinigri]|uniref:DNA polymerase Y family protein n=1 Tax=Halopseudomonas sabulinigri TaxID=472181 RepID=A0ABP9ZR36_9GAMM
MRWACILLPQLALDAVLRTREDPLQPLVLVQGPVQRRLVQAVNPAARELGIRRGQTLTAARALSDDFVCVEHDPEHVQYWQTFLAAWAYRFSSHVSLDYPRALLVEVQSSLGLFGPWPRFEQRLRRELTELGFSHRIAVAPNALAARVLVNVADGLAVDELQLPDYLRELPVSRSGFAPEAAEALARMGLRKLHQVLALPRASLARRFPCSLLDHLDTLQGLHPLALGAYQPPDDFAGRVEFNFEVESIASLLFPLRRLTGDLAVFLAGRDCGVQRFVLLLEHREGESTQVPVGLLSAEREPGMLFELARGRLEAVQLRAPVQAFAVRAQELPRFVPAAGELFVERPQQSLAWEQLRERLRARLGDEAVQGLALCADHRPEQAWSAQPQAGAAQLDEPPRPGWLLAEPQPLDDLFPRILCGPERIESGWWDGGDVRRDYYLVETRDGRRAWAFHAAGGAGPMWVHGWFA